MFSAFDVQPVTSAQEAENWSKLNDKAPAQQNSGAQSANKQADDTKTKGASAENKTTTEKDTNKKEDKTKARPEDQTKTSEQDTNAKRNAEQDKLQKVVDDPNTPWYKKVGAKINQGWNSFNNWREDNGNALKKTMQDTKDWSEKTLNDKDSAWYKKLGAKVVSWIF